MPRAASLPMVLTAVSLALAQGVNLSTGYPATLDWAESAPGQSWTCEPNDVWRLTGFSYALGDELKIELGPATLAIGKHGANAVWAVVIPDQPGKLRSNVTDKDEGLTSLWLRFNPSRVGELLPSETVLGHGPPDVLVWARRLCAWKMQGCWQANGLPVIPSRQVVVLDMETASGPRRFFSVDTDAQTVRYEPFFAQRNLPKTDPVDAAEALAALETTWRAFDAEYAMFGLRPTVDWNKLRDEYRPRAKMARTNYEVAALLAEMLATLEDLHVSVRVGDEFVPGFDRPRPLNASWKAASKLIGPLQDVPRTLSWGRTKDDLGYVNLYMLGNADLPAAFDAALDKLADTWGLIIDLRYNGGGDEDLGQRVAGRLLENPCVYSYSRYRNGPQHGDLTEKLPRQCAPRGPWRYAAPLAVLIGPRTMSSAESLVWMLAAAPQAVTIGDRTAGSSGNPHEVEAGCGIAVTVPRWIDLGPDGEPFDTAGIQPQIRVNTKPEEFTAQQDPVLEKALEHLRAQPQDLRRPGKNP